MNVLTETHSGLPHDTGATVLTPHEAQMRLAQVDREIEEEVSRGWNLDDLKLARLRKEARTLYAVINPEVAYNEICDGGDAA